MNDIGLGAMRMHDKGWTKGWGLGRHVLGSNYFHYVHDPWGELRPILLRYRLHPEGGALAVRRPQAGGITFISGVRTCRGNSRSIMKAARPSSSTQTSFVMAGTH